MVRQKGIFVQRNDGAHVYCLVHVKTKCRQNKRVHTFSPITIGPQHEERVKFGHKCPYICLTMYVEMTRICLVLQVWQKRFYCSLQLDDYFFGPRFLIKWNNATFCDSDENEQTKTQKFLNFPLPLPNMPQRYFF